MQGSTRRYTVNIQDDDLYIPKKKATPKLTPKRGINAKSTAAHDPGMGRKARCLWCVQATVRD